MPSLEILISITVSDGKEAAAVIEAIEDGGGIESKAGLTELASDVKVAYYFVDKYFASKDDVEGHTVLHRLK